jgi:uncharacterized membrane protein
MQAEGIAIPKLVTIGFIVVIIGIVLMIIGILSLALRGQGKSEYGGVIVIGPLPIVFGSGSTAVKIAVIGAIILMVLAILLMLLPLLILRHGPLPQA